MSAVLIRLLLVIQTFVGLSAARLPCRFRGLDDANGRLARLLDAPYHDPAQLAPARDVRLSIGRKDAEGLFALTVKSWNDYYDPDTLRPILEKVQRHGSLLPDELLKLKAIRKRAMLVRAAFLALDAGHEPPKDLHEFVRDFGAMNDSLTNKDPKRAAKIAGDVLAATKGKTLGKAFDRFDADRRKDIARHLNDTVRSITSALDKNRLLADDFHTVRKQLRELQAVLRTELAFSENADLSLFIDHLHALNLRTGLVHDELIKKELAGAIDYDKEKVAVPEALRRDVTRLLAHLEFREAPISESAP